MSACPVDKSTLQSCPVDKSTLQSCPVEKSILEAEQSCPVDSTLGTERQESSIPKDNSSKWMYPSEEQFHQAMLRKNKKIGDVAQVVKIHNTVNERVWKEILDWENFKDPSLKCPPLLSKFTGRPTAITPKARLYQLFGYKLPFDRHDWTITRCGKETTYVIDFYTAKGLGFYLDVRPAMSLEGVRDRLKYWWHGLWK